MGVILNLRWMNHQGSSRHSLGNLNVDFGYDLTPYGTSNMQTVSLPEREIIEL